ncbi:MAG: flagellar hook-associated protein FlgK [Hyphomicrobiales bacterium]|nr:MAG: flagellar hook-associated protein FlgK [Hyphomicrobiales bacterium]
MSISSALSIAISGLRVTQQQVELASGNIANADTEGYTRKVTSTENIAIDGNRSLGVRRGDVQRTLDTFVLERYQASLSNSTNANVLADFQARLDAMYGAPGEITALDTIFNGFTASLEALSTSPEDITTRGAVLSDAQTLAARLNAMSAEIQSMRVEAERQISDSVDQVNSLLTSIQNINADIIRFSAGDVDPVQLLDQRDQMVSELSQLMDINVDEAESNGITIHTGNGILLFDGNSATLSFDEAGTITPYSEWSDVDSERLVGTITLDTSLGYSIDLIGQNSFSSGSLAAYVKLRDDILVEAQAQLDEFASALSLALSNRTEEGTAVDTGTQTGFDLDLTGLQAGNPITFEYIDVVSGDTETVTFIRVDDPTLLPLDDSVTANAGDTVYGIDFSGGLATATADIGAALGASFTVSDQGGNVLRILDDGGTNVTSSAMAASITNTALSDEGVALPLFVDGGEGPAVYTDSLDGRVQKTGYAGRIVVNPDLLADSSKLVEYDTVNGTYAGDATRPTAMIEALTESQFSYSADSGIGSGASPFSGSVSGFLREVINNRSSATAAADREKTTQETTTNALSEKLVESSKVDLDQELSALIELQNAYAANARVMQTVREMLDTLMAI